MYTVLNELRQKRLVTSKAGGLLRAWIRVMVIRMGKKKKPTRYINKKNLFEMLSSRNLVISRMCVRMGRSGEVKGD